MARNPKAGTSMNLRRATLLLAALLCLAPAGAAELHSYAIVQDDATLRIRNTTVHLYGIHIPETGRHCRTFMRPVICGSRAVLALEFKIQGFVRCELLTRHHDRSATGRCFVGEEDLSAYLLSQGWALALPDAPFQYHALERIARHQHRGVWGFSADQIQPRR